MFYPLLGNCKPPILCYYEEEMLRYSSSTHRKLMHESEYALQAASASPSPRISRIVGTILSDGRIYREWESTHASLLLPIAQRRKSLAQLMELRSAEVELIHRRALFGFLQRSGVTGERRRRLFRTIHTTRDFEDAVLAEHRRYMMAVSSHVSADHLIDVMKDVNSKQLLEVYQDSYMRYFEMRCFLVTADSGTCADLVRLTMRDAAKTLRRAQARVETELPVTDGGDFDREQALANSGRYPVLNYMIG